MAKQRSTNSGKPEVAALQKEIAKLDKEIVRLINQRAKLTQRRDRSLLQEGLPRGERCAKDHQACEASLKSNRGPLDDDEMRIVMMALSSAARRLTSHLRVCYLGPPFSYSHVAAQKYFGGHFELNDVISISSVFEDVLQSHADFGVVPLENSTDGRVSDTLEMFIHNKVKICGEVKLRINHCLLSRSDRLKIEEVCSKPQAMSQCRGWLAAHLPNAKLTEMASTTAAAKYAVENPRVAAIASREAGIHYGLDVIDEAIQDKTGNLTRFAILGMEPGTRTGNDKTSYLFALPHQPGALADMMNIFKRNRLNMTWIESFPAPDSNDEYLFFVETDGHVKDLKVRQAIAALTKKASRLEILGSCPRGEPVG